MMNKLNYYFLIATILILLNSMDGIGQDIDTPYHGGKGDGYAKGNWQNQETFIFNNNELPLKLVPNIISQGDYVSIQNGASFYDAARVVDILGREVFAVEAVDENTLEQSLNNLNLSPSTYFLKLQRNHTSLQVKFVVN